MVSVNSGENPHIMVGVSSDENHTTLWLV